MKHLVGGIVLCVTLAATGTANAFCRTMSCELGEAERVADGGAPCARDAKGCVSEGTAVHWGSSCIDYAVQTDGSPKLGLDADTFQLIVARAFAAWENARCPGGGSPRFHARFQGFASCDRVEHVCGGASSNVNVIMFHDHDWTDGHAALGLTRPAGTLTSGLLIDADLELNSADFAFKVDSTSAGDFNLDDVVAHEVGHFLGLDHSNVSGALMSVDYQSLALSRELLTADDIEAICAAYPPGAELACAAPSAPAYDACQLPPGAQPTCRIATMTHDSKGCTIGRAPTPGNSAWAILLGSLPLLRRTRRRSASSKRQ